VVVRVSVAASKMSTTLLMVPLLTAHVHPPPKKTLPPSEVAALERALRACDRLVVVRVSVSASKMSTTLLSLFMAYSPPPKKTLLPAEAAAISWRAWDSWAVDHVLVVVS
jgi:hypothetical protein